MISDLNKTHDAASKSFVESANTAETDFPIQNLPLGVFSRPNERPRIGVAIGDFIVDLEKVADADMLSGQLRNIIQRQETSLNALFAAGSASMSDLRHQVFDLADARTNHSTAKFVERGLLVEQVDATMHLPSKIGNYTDFYAGIHHARAAGALMQPDNPLPENYLWVPIAYHGRASSVIVSGEPVRRPLGQRRSPTNEPPGFGACQRLDLELEMGFYISSGNPLGQNISIGDARQHIAGYCLLNDWSARDIQMWEMFPLGPFLGKSFSTTVSPWVVMREALEPFRTAAMARGNGLPEPLPYLADETDRQSGSFDIHLSVKILTEQMRRAALPAEEIIHSNARHLYWTTAQMVAHHASGGCNLLPGDLIGTGTISGPSREELSSLLELTFGGTQPVVLGSGEERQFLADGDEVSFSARCKRDGFASIGFGQCTGRILPAVQGD